MKKIILLSLLTIVGILGANQMVLADTATLSTSPASLNSTAGTPFNVSVQLNPTNNKVCVVTGTVSFNNLSCQGITVASGLMAQTTPTCANPSFIVGIPKCTTVAQNILSVSVKGIQAGQANLSIIGVKVIGAGADVAFTAQGGTYSIVAVSVKPTPKPTPNPTPTPTQQVTQPTQQTTQQVAAPTQQTSPENNLLGNGGPASFASVASPYFWPLLIILIILAVGYGIYYLVKRKKK